MRISRHEPYVIVVRVDGGETVHWSAAGYRSPACQARSRAATYANADAAEEAILNRKARVCRSCDRFDRIPLRRDQ